MKSTDKNLLPILVICLGVGLLYMPALLFDYVWDDGLWLGSLRRHDGDIWTLAFLKPFLVGNLYWRPLAELTLYFQPGDKPQLLQHGINILLHLLNIALLVVVGYLAMAKDYLKQGKWFYFIVLAFALHPAFVEPVAWVSGRFDLMLTTVFLLSMICLLRFDNENKRNAYLALVFAVSLLVKETAILFIPVFMGLLWLITPEQSLKDLVKREKRLLLLLGVIAVAWLVLRTVILGGTGAGFLFKNIGSVLSPFRLYMIFSTVGAYLGLLVLPFKGLSTLYPVGQMLDSIWYGVLGLACVASTALLLKKTGDAKKLGIILGLFLVSLLLVLNILEVGFPDNLIQNRYLYPTFAILACALFVSRIRVSLSPLGDKGFTVLAAAWLVLAVLNVNVTLPLWKNEDTLTSWFYIENPGNPYAANLRGGFLLRNGYIEAAIETVGEVAVNKPSHTGYQILGEGHYVLGQCEAALVYFDYAQDMAGFSVEKAQGLLGMYRIKVHQDKEEAQEIKAQIVEALADDAEQLSHALKRMETLENTEIVCRDESEGDSKN